jgi:hypothetical protein
LSDSWNQDASDIVLLGQGDQGLLPHIDTCVGLVCKLKDGRVLCAHASSIPKPTPTEKADALGPDQGEALQRMASAIGQKVGSGQVASVVAVGPSDWKSLVQAHFQNVTFESTDTYPQGADVTVNSSGDVTVSAYKKS